MEKPAPTSHPVHDLIRRRWSPRGFSAQAVDEGTLSSLLEAARWASSASNEQPWRFIVATQDHPEEFDRLVGILNESNQVWARNAPVLILSVASLVLSKTQAPNRHAYHDVGTASAQMVMEAVSRGLFVHPMAGFNVEAAREILNIPEGYDPVTVFAVGYPGDPDDLPEPNRAREFAARVRKPLSEIVFNGLFGNPYIP